MNSFSMAVDQERRQGYVPDSGHVNYRMAASADGVQSLVNEVRHRGPDDHGISASPSRRCILGHARLSVIDLSPLGRQPMVDPETGNCIVFNREICNFLSLRSECEAQGDKFRTRTHTEEISRTLSLSWRRLPPASARDKLPIPVVTESRIGQHEAPSDPVETAIAEIWTNLIGPARPIGRADKFFEMGGHSLLALQALDKSRTSSA